MRSINKKIILTLSSVFLIAFSCEEIENFDEPLEISSKKKIYSKKFEKTHYNKDFNNSYTLSIEFQITENYKNSENINSKIRNLVFSDDENGINYNSTLPDSSSFSKLFEYKKQLADEDVIGDFDYYENRKIELINDFTNIFSFSYSIDYYTGGAHPNYNIAFFNINLENGKEIEIEDFITDIEQLNIIAESIFFKEHEINQSSIGESGYWFENNKFRLNNNFAIKKDGILFLFNTYEIASYAEGAIELFIPYEKISDILYLKQFNNEKKVL